MSTDAMRQKAEQLIAADSHAAWLAANVKRDGTRYRKHRPYEIPERARDLVAALDAGDAETVAAIMLYRYAAGATEPA